MVAKPLAKPDPAIEDDGERAATASSVYTRRARFFDSGNAFNLKYPAVPCHQFMTERDQALDPGTGTALIPLDLSDQLDIPFPVTTPLILTCYARIRARDRLETSFTASGELYYVIEGAGHSIKGADWIDWASGDIFCLPGGGETIHIAGDDDCVLWVITNQPALAFEHLQPASLDDPVTEAVHYPAAEIDHQLERVRSELQGEDIAGLALVFSHERQAKSRNILPTLTLAMNQLPPKDMQRPHRHNSVAITLNIRCQGCYSMIDGKRVDWQPGAVMVTPPGDVHSHHNDGDEIMTCLIVQDGGLYYHCRTMGFEFVDD
ncbi:MAG: cupin domain-containing protein [Alphaproteobacteria bacterium]|nr:cupin domain-containing protein [Alphaproteobacteria bacterium]